MSNPLEIHAFDDSTEAYRFASRNATGWSGRRAMDPIGRASSASMCWKLLSLQSNRVGA
jgi:hypothetical protein